jgi:predicted RNase H-like HicB family nuclease
MFTRSPSISRELTVFVAMTRLREMAAAGFTYWQDGEMWLGYLDQYPDYMTQGTSLEDLKEHLLDLYKDLSSGVIPNVRQHSELELA